MNLNLKKKLFAMMIIATAIPFSLSALEVDIDEIGNTQRVNFKNYEGKVRRSNTLPQIRNIGYSLSRGTRSKGHNSSYRLTNGKYSIIRVKSKSEPKKFDADILKIRKAALIDHIKNVRRILSAYLERTYDYTPKEADAIALYTTYYNAVHRGDMEYFDSKYKKAVTQFVSPGTVGIARSYYNWPGKTAILIPMTRDSKRERINAFLISDRKTRQEIAKDEEAVEPKETLKKIKEREVEQEKKEIAETKKKIEENKVAIDKKKQKLSQKKQSLAERKRQLKKEKAKAAKINDPRKRKEAMKKIAKEENKIRQDEGRQLQEEKTIAKAEDNTARYEEKVKQKSEEVVNQENQLKEEKQEEQIGDNSQAMEELAKKEKELEKREEELRNKSVDKNIFADKLYYLKIKGYLEGGHYNNELFMINPKTMKVDIKSPVTSICGRKYDVNSKGVVVIGHRGDHKAGHRLLLLDRKNLKMVKTGDTNIFWRSFIRVVDNHIYVVMRKEGYQYLGKFDFDLNLVAMSDTRVYENTFITFFQDFIYINRYDKKVMVLNKNDLKFIAVVKE